jgi:hypothetical protein
MVNPVLIMKSLTYQGPILQCIRDLVHLWSVDAFREVPVPGACLKAVKLGHGHDHTKRYILRVDKPHIAAIKISIAISLLLDSYVWIEHIGLTDVAHLWPADRAWQNLQCCSWVVSQAAGRGRPARRKTARSDFCRHTKENRSDLLSDSAEPTLAVALLGDLDLNLGDSWRSGAAEHLAGGENPNNHHGGPWKLSSTGTIRASPRMTCTIREASDRDSQRPGFLPAPATADPVATSPSRRPRHQNYHFGQPSSCRRYSPYHRYFSGSGPVQRNA